MMDKQIRLNEEQIEVLKHLLNLEIAKIELLKTTTLEQKLKLKIYQKILKKL